MSYNLLINPPKNPPITAKEFHALTYFGLGSFMVNYPIFIEEKKDEIVLYCKDYKANYFHGMPRFAEVIPGKINQSAELGYFNIPKGTKLHATISKYFSHLYLKDEAAV